MKSLVVIATFVLLSINGVSTFASVSHGGAVLAAQQQGPQTDQIPDPITDPQPAPLHEAAINTAVGVAAVLQDLDEYL
jgi:hypothetical protein